MFGLISDNTLSLRLAFVNSHLRLTPAPRSAAQTPECRYLGPSFSDRSEESLCLAVAGTATLVIATVSFPRKRESRCLPAIRVEGRYPGPSHCEAAVAISINQFANSLKMVSLSNHSLIPSTSSSSPSPLAVSVVERHQNQEKTRQNIAFSPASRYYASYIWIKIRPTGFGPNRPEKG